MNQYHLVFINGKLCLVALVLLIASVVACFFFSTPFLGSRFSDLNPKLSFATSTAKSLRTICTANNGVRRWLNMMPQSTSKSKKNMLRPPTYSLSGPGLKTSAFQWTWPSGSSPPITDHRRFRSAYSPAPPELRLPVGLALGLEIAHLRKEESRSTTSIYIGREGLRKQAKYLARLRRDVTLQCMLGESPARRARLERLAAAAIRHHVPLALAPIQPACRPRRHSRSDGGGGGGGGDSSSMHWATGDDGFGGSEGAGACRRVDLYRRRLTGLQGARYTDAMVFPGTAALLYWGSFRQLKFDGWGTLFYREGGVAYSGEWSKGLMDGCGELRGATGEVLWQGLFRAGLPVSSPCPARSAVKDAGKRLGGQQ